MKRIIVAAQWRQAGKYTLGIIAEQTFLASGKHILVLQKD
jgi:hypothetical protein